jgi:hypothetical protein
MDLDPCASYDEEDRNVQATSFNYCYLYKDLKGYWLDDSGQCYRNCSSICTNQTLLFSYYDTIEGCLNWSPDERSDNIENGSLIEFDRTHGNAVNLLNGCMEQYCKFEDEKLGGCPYTNITVPTNGSKSAMYDFETVSGGCDVARTVNADLGGPGVGFVLSQ